MNVGDYVQRTAGLKDRIGKPLEASSKEGHLAAVRRFFTDCQEWEWLPRRFDPQRALSTPRSIAALLGPNPRVIADEIWAKLLWAGLNLDTDDLPVTKAGHFHPLELVRAVTVTWLFSGLRSDEIARLRVGCIRWQHEETAIVGDSDEVLRCHGNHRRSRSIDHSRSCPGVDSPPGAAGLPGHYRVSRALAAAGQPSSAVTS